MPKSAKKTGAKSKAASRPSSPVLTSKKLAPEKSNLPPIPEERWKPAEVITALTEARGFVSKAARALGCHPQTVRNYMERYPEVAAARKEAREEIIDIAEDALLTAVRIGEGWAVCFLLKCQAKSRGYVERREMSGVDSETGKPLPQPTFRVEFVESSSDPREVSSKG